GRRVARHERGWDWGIVFYPAAVLALILIFNWHIAIAAVVWVIMAFGDGFATLIGRALPLWRLPWNREKSMGGSIAFLLFGGGARKAGAGLGQEKGGRRGAGHAIANVGVAALCAVACWRGLGLVPLFMGISALATAAADTTGSEIGKLFGKRAFLPLTFKRVERGTDGAISLERTLAGIVAAFLVALAGTSVSAHHLRPRF